MHYAFQFIETGEILCGFYKEISHWAVVASTGCAYLYDEILMLEAIEDLLPTYLENGISIKSIYEIKFT